MFSVWSCTPTLATLIMLLVVTLITAAPVLVDVYLVGDFGIWILIGTAIGAIWVGHRFERRMDEVQSGEEVPGIDPVPPPAVPR